MKFAVKALFLMVAICVLNLSFSPSIYGAENEREISHSNVANCTYLLTGSIIAPWVPVATQLGLALNKQRWTRKITHNIATMLAVYTGLSVGLTVVDETYFSTPQSAVYKSMDQETVKPTNRVLLIDANAGGGEIAQIDMTKELNRRYGSSNITTVNVLNAEDLMAKLEKLNSETQNPFDLMILFAHGQPQRIELGSKGTIYNPQDLKKIFAGHKFERLSHSQSVLWLVSCSLLSQSPQNDLLVSTFANAWLPFGGKVIGAPRNIRTDSILAYTVGYIGGAGVLMPAVSIGFKSYQNLSTTGQLVQPPIAKFEIQLK